MRGLIGLMCLAGAVTLAAQTPQPFPTPRERTPPPAPVQPPRTPPQTSAPPPAPAPGRTVTTAGAPDLGDIPLYPSAVYLTSYEAGRGQRFYLYGVQLSFDEAVAYYRAALKEKGDELFETPPTYQFELGRFRDSEMAFPPSITVKDYTWGGSGGYVNPQPGASPGRFPTLIQIVLPPVAR